ncbi:helix-turn-helix domain-containing protein [Kocuria salina]|uniref:hypothetical protein n=1 Tax=Kocuria salina TaxID=1929416 RepID=UPI0015946357|nr:hypothetical protein [Kocuria salina]NVC23421.1 helix-turn-helix domain-containing protein [Kocuria salina]
MEDEARFRGYSPKEVAELTKLYGEHELRRMAAGGEISHHRGSRNRIIFFADDIASLLERTRREPVPPAQVPDSSAELFRQTPRSAAIHRGKQPFPPPRA